jgi:transcription elongation factor Elf1
VTIDLPAPINTMVEEYEFTCPYCWQQISMLLDATSGNQSYVEDCEVCCNPIAISYECNGNDISAFTATVAQ